MGRGGGSRSWRFGDGPGPAHGAEGGRHEELAAPTCAVPAQAAELDRLGNIRPRPAPLVKERTTMEGRTEALTSKAIVGLKACTRREDDL